MFRWNGLWIGLSLGAFGVCQTLLQAFLPGPAVARLGERAIVGPLEFSTLYFVVRDRWPGAIWLSAVVVYAMAVPLMLTLQFRTGNQSET